MKKRSVNFEFSKVLIPLGTKEDSNLKFFGVYYRILKTLVNLFTPKYDFKVQAPTAANVYICRHKNMKGVVKLMKSTTFDMHPFALSVFQNFKSAFNQFYGYTFTKRLKLPEFIAVIPAFISAIVVSPLIKSAKAIPTYRKDAKAFLTLKTATEYLVKGESVIIFPDIDYTSENTGVGEIYQGFLQLEKLFYKKTHRHLDFIPIKIDDCRREITSGEPLSFKGDLPFEIEIKNIAKQIKNNI